MGLIKEGDDYIVLTDIAGVEDHLGDMDFKVAGTAEGITALQMDIKITGVTFEILADALEQANKGRQFILGKMAEAIDGPREKLSEYAPRDRVDQDRPREDRRRDRQRRRNDPRPLRGVRSRDRRRGRRHGPRSTRRPARWSRPASQRIESMTKEAEVGDRYDAAKVVKTTTFGAFVELVKGTDGLLHISNVKPGERVDTVDDVLTAATRSTSPWSRSTRSAAGSACASPTTPRSRANRPRSWRAVGSGDGGRRNGGDRGGDRGGRGGRGGRRRTRAPRRSSSVERCQRSPSLGSGVRVVTEEVPSVRSVALGLWVAHRIARRDPGQAGVSHFLEHLLFKGTERYSAIEISELFDGLGASVNAATGKETTHLHARFLDEHTEEAFDLLAEMLLAPTYPDIDSEREVVLEEIAMYEDEPQDRVHDVLADAVFGDAPARAGGCSARPR